MMTAQEMIPDREIDRVWGRANFGDMERRTVVDQGVLKCAAGYHQGSTSRHIITELGLVTAIGYKLTRKGREYLWAAFSNPPEESV